MKNKYRIICGLLAGFVITAQYFVLIAEGTYGGLAATTLTYFGFFTVLTNILVALAFSASLLPGGLQRFFERQSVRAAIALYIFVVMVIYYAVLAKDHHPEGISAVFNVCMHLIIPLLYLIDWLVFARKDHMPFKALPLWTVYPILYGIFNLARGMKTGFYPYPFLDISKLGAAGVSVNMLGFTLFYMAGGAAFILLGRLLSRKA